MNITLEEMKQYLRVDYDDDDSLIEYLLNAAKQICMDILRSDDESILDNALNGRGAILYTTAYLYEHRQEADHHALMITLRSLLSGEREVEF